MFLRFFQKYRLAGLIKKMKSISARAAVFLQTLEYNFKILTTELFKYYLGFSGLNNNLCNGPQQ
jgi:hypothetical protein